MSVLLTLGAVGVTLLLVGIGPILAVHLSQDDD
jgi:hypothetical protein